ncbi:hypothetical protein MBLNU459_g0678t1 [Dothideomycetes sp. NU459]
MALQKYDGLELNAPADFHVHLRDGPMMELVTPTIRQGGVNTVFVMPNLVPPITTVAHALDYKKRLEALEPNVTFLMSLYLHPSITPAVVEEAAAAGITGIKSYPAGVTTNSSSGVVSYEPFYPVFAAMEQHGLILNLHGEVPASATNSDITVLSAEEAFLPTLATLHAAFPRLRIILEHCTTAAAVAAVRGCGPTVAATLTAHHLSLIVDDWAGDPHCFCKPVAKTPADRRALLRAAVSGDPKFFLGTDSAPHPAVSKRGDKVAAGVFTQPHAVGYVLSALELAVEKGVIGAEDVSEEKLQGFLGGYGRKFYGAADKRAADERGEKVVLRKDTVTVQSLLKNADGSVEVVPFRRDQKTWGVEWK